MKALVFHIGPDRYGLPLVALARVLPVMELKQLPLAPPWVAGLMDLHGQPLPVIDLSLLAGLPAQPPCFDSRIIVVDYADGGVLRQLGLLAEHVIGIESIADDAFADAGVRGARFLGQVAGTGNGMLQLVEPQSLLAPEVRALLFQPREAA